MPGEEGPGRAPVRDRRRRGETRARRADGCVVPGRVRPLNLMPHPRPALGRDQRQAQGPRPRTTSATPGDLQPQRRRPAPVRRLRSDPRPSVRARQASTDPHPVPGLLLLLARPVSHGGSDRDRQRQLLPASDHQAVPPGGGLGRGQQRRDRLHPDELLVAQPHRGPVYRAALLRSGRDGPRQPQGAGQHDPPLHRLA